VARIRNEQVRQFWIAEYDHYPPRMRAEAIAPIQAQGRRVPCRPSAPAHFDEPREAVAASTDDGRGQDTGCQLSTRPDW
jgi:hypothetical protein